MTAQDPPAELLTPNPHHRLPRPVLSWDVPRADGAAGGLTDDLRIAKRRLLQAMQEATEPDVAGLIRTVEPASDPIDYGLTLVRAWRDRTTSTIVVDEPGQPGDQNPASKRWAGQ